MRVRVLILCCLAVFASGASLGGAPNETRPVIDAARKSDTALLRALLQKRADPNIAEPDGTTALHWAARRNNLDAVRLLVAAGANPNATNRSGVTTLLSACESGSAPVVEQLLKAGASVNGALPEGETPLMTAARTGKVDVVKLLVAHGADVNARETWHGQTALMWAAADNHPAVIAALVESGADVHARSEGGFTPILFAARDGKTGAVDSLLRLGANVKDTLQPSAAAVAAHPSTRPFASPRDGAGTSALVLAIGSAHYETAKFLLERGADPNAADNGWTPLHELEYTRRHQRSRGLPPPEQTGTVGSLELAELLLKRGANPNTRQTKERNDGQRNALNRLGATPFLLSAKYVDAPMMRLLAAHRADVRIPTMGQTTPLSVAAGVGIVAVSDDIGTNEEAFEAVKTAYELGDRNVNAADTRGWTALHGAALRGANPIVQFLADRGADLEAVTKTEGWTALRIADGVFHTATFKRAEETAALIRQLLRARGLPVPPIPDVKQELEERQLGQPSASGSPTVPR